MTALSWALLGVVTGGCGSDKPGGFADLPSHGVIDPRDRCATPNAGCSCREPNRVVECGQVERQAAGQTWCSIGHRTCAADGSWGECEIEGLTVLPTPPGAQRAQSLGSIAPCADNPCDPFCQQVLDTASDLQLPPGLRETSEGGISLASKDGPLNGTSCTGIEIVPSPQSLTVTSLSAQGASSGLLGEYFDALFDADEIPASSTPKLTRVDAPLDFTWYGAPGEGLPDDNFTVRWTGWIQPAVTRAYQLCVLSDDGVRVWLGDGPAPLIDHWDQHGPTSDCAPASQTLTAGKPYKIRVEYFDAGGAAVARLSWKHQAAPEGEPIPSANLLPAGSEDASAGFRVSPSAARFSVRALPDGCFDGPVHAAWTVDRLDRAKVDDSGKVSLRSPVAGDVAVTAYVGEFSATAKLTVNVDATDTERAPSGSVPAFEAAPSGADPVQVLYPYTGTVFPLGLAAPTIQWNRGGAAADAVKVSLRSPASGAARFTWSAIVPEPDPGRFEVPQDVWSTFAASAQGQSAAYTLQRVTGGAVRPAVTREFSLASAPLRGKIYYTQYGRDGSARTMVAEPGAPAAARPVFDSDAAGVNGQKCPVCHSVSANGGLFAAADRSYGANGGLSQIGSDGRFTRLSDFTTVADPYRNGAEDFRGFAWAPLTPDGKYALSANNIWGNSRELAVGIDPATRSVAVPGTFLSGGSGTGLLAQYYLDTSLRGWDWRRTDPKIDFAWADSPGGPVPESFSARWSGELQALTSEMYTFFLRSSGGVKLTLDGALLIDQLDNVGGREFRTARVLSRGQRVPIEVQFVDRGGDAAIALDWETPTVARQRVPQTQLYPNAGWHGLLATYYDHSDFTAPFITDRIESNLDADWGAGGPRPMPSGDDDNWSAVYRGRLEAPVSGDLAICARASDDVRISLAGSVRLDEVGASDGCSAPLPVTGGARYDLEVRFRELTGSAALQLSWAMPGRFEREVVPSERLSPPAGWAPPERGLSASYYATSDFNASLATNAPSFASRRIEANADLNWGDGRPEFSSALTDNDTFSARLTGRLEAPCAGVYEFEVAAGGGARLWLDAVRVVNLDSRGARQGALWLSQGLHDLKLEQGTEIGAAHLNLRWKAACLGGSSFVPIPSANLYPSGDAGAAGYVQAGGDNGNGQSYFVWQTPNAPGAPPVDVTGESAGRWGLGSTVMMVPSFSPDGSKLVFIDGDSAAGNGWRKGLSTFSFDPGARLFQQRKTIVSTWPSGDVMKWPAFESDSRSVIYQATTPADLCCRDASVPRYGFMAPTNYFEDPGRLFSVDTEAASPRPVELAHLNRGERALDHNKAYQATMSPEVAGGYRWAVFASTRPYGNTLNLAGQQDFSDPSAYTPISDSSKLQSMLWVGAVDDVTSGATDRSHPAFFLPSQSFDENASRGFSNERAVWVAEACRPAGTGAASACDVDQDCCDSATGAAVCRVDVPVASPVTRHCFALPASGSCTELDGACASTEACCGGTVCSEGVCLRPPGFSSYSPANFTRVYGSNCADGHQVDWTFFDYKARVPAANGALEFYAESSDDADGFQSLPPYPAKVDLPGVVLLGVQGPPGDLTQWTRIPLDQAFSEGRVVDRRYLQITVRFVPNESGAASPLLTEWRQSFSCPPAE